MSEQERMRERERERERERKGAGPFQCRFTTTGEWLGTFIISFNQF